MQAWSSKWAHERLMISALYNGTAVQKYGYTRSMPEGEFVGMVVCKKCKEVLPDGTQVCTCCGAKVKPGKAKKPKPQKQDGEKKPLSAKLKIAGCALGIAVIVVLVIVLVVAIIADDGKNTAKALSEYIGDSMLTAINDSDIKVYDESKYKAVNNAMKFNYIVESDDSVKVDGINFPEWAVTVCLNNDEEIVTVSYTDFTVCKKNHKGPEAKSFINLDNVKKNEKYKEVTKEIDLDVYSITYDNSFVTYTYKYYYEDESKNEQAVRLTVTFNKAMEYQYYASELVYPDDI